MNLLRNIKNQLVRLHNDERGGEGIEKLLIIGAIVIPLLGVLVFFRTELASMLERLWGDVGGDTNYENSSF